MKKLIIGITVLLLACFSASRLFAAPNNSQKAQNNPQVVAYYTSGIHAIPTNPITYVYGTDLVTTRGDTGMIEQWYTGTNGHGIHSVWNITRTGTCPIGWVFVSHAYPAWGYYLIPNIDYCVMNNTF